MSQMARQRMQEAMLSRGIDLAIFYRSVNVRYLTGYSSLDTDRPISYTRPNVVCLRTSGEGALIVPVLGEESARQMGSIDNVIPYSGLPPNASALDAWLGFATSGGGGKISRIGWEADYLPLLTAESIRDRFRGASFVDITPVIEGLRLIKTAEEVQAIKSGAELADRILAETIPLAVAGTSENQVEWHGLELVKTVGKRYADNIDVLSLVLSGPRSAMTHASTSRRPIQTGEPVMHAWLVAANGYWCEDIRTVPVGAWKDKRAGQMFEAVHEAFDAALAIVRPGTLASDIFDIVQRVFSKNGLQDLILTRRAGHGVGLEYQEQPIIDAQTHIPLSPGMTFSLEPGVWAPGFGGFTVAETLLITETGYERITQHPLWERPRI